MGVKGVLRNVRKKGIVETGNIFIERHIKAGIDKQLDSAKKHISSLEKELNSIKKNQTFFEREQDIKRLIGMAEEEEDKRMCFPKFTMHILCCR